MPHKGPNEIFQATVYRKTAALIEMVKFIIKKQKK